MNQQQHNAVMFSDDWSTLLWQLKPFLWWGLKPPISINKQAFTSEKAQIMTTTVIAFWSNISEEFSTVYWWFFPHSRIPF